MGHIISLHGDPHRQTATLLPWYVAGTLDADDIAAVEAHLAGCDDCRASLIAERTLRDATVSVPIDVERGWGALRARLADDVATTRPPVDRRGRATRWLIVAQAAAIAGLGYVAIVPQVAKAPDYHALGTAPVASAGNIVASFRPDTTERALRAMLEATGARIVDGPTTTGAYVLRVRDADRTAALATLRARPDVTLAEPIDAGAAP